MIRKETNITNTIENQQVASFVEDAESDGVVDELALGAFAVELDLDDEELAALRSELEARGVEISASDETLDGVELRLEPDAAGATDSVTLFMNDIGKHDLLTAAEEVELAKRIERGDASA